MDINSVLESHWILLSQAQREKLLIEITNTCYRCSDYIRFSEALTTDDLPSAIRGRLILSMTASGLCAKEYFRAAAVYSGKIAPKRYTLKIVPHVGEGDSHFDYVDAWVEFDGAPIVGSVSVKLQSLDGATSTKRAALIAIATYEAQIEACRQVVGSLLRLLRPDGEV